jgi:hypothetical protein
LQAAWNQIRDGQADVMLLRRGDSWGSTGIALNKAGASASARIIVAAYGDSRTARPAVGMLRPDNATAARNQILAHLSMTSNSGGDIVMAGQGIRIEGCLFTGPPSGQSPALVHMISGGLSMFRNAYHRMRIFSHPVMGRAMVTFEEVAMYHNPDYVVSSGFAQHNNYFNYHEGDIVSRSNISAFSPGVGFRQRGLGTVEGNLVLGSRAFAFDIGTQVDENPASPTRGTYLTFRHNLVLNSPGGASVFANPRNALIEQNIFKSRVAYGHYAGVWPVTGITMQDNIFYDTDFSPWGGHSGSIAGPWIIRRNDFQRPGGGGLMTLRGAGFTFEASNRYYSSDAQSGWFDSAYSNRVPSTGSNTQVSYSAPNRDIVTYMQTLGLRPANADQAIEWFMNGVPGSPSLSGAIGNRLGAWDDRFTSRAVINHVRAGFDLAPLD